MKIESTASHNFHKAKNEKRSYNRPSEYSGIQQKKAGRKPASKTIRQKRSRPPAPRRGSRLFRHDVFRILQFSQNCLGVILEFVSIGRLVDETLQVIGRLLILCFVTGAEQRKTGAKVGVRIVRFLSENLLEFGVRLIARTRVEQHLRQIKLRP